MDHDEILEQIAAEYLNVPDLAPLYSERLEFYELSVWQIRSALEAAFAAGQAARPSHNADGAASFLRRCCAGIGPMLRRHFPSLIDSANFVLRQRGGEQEMTTMVEEPFEAVHQGRTYHRTGKTGTDIATGKRVIEMSCHYSENDIDYEDRIWVADDGEIFPD